MATYGPFNYTSFQGVNLRTSAGIRFPADVSGNESTLSIKASSDTARAWSFPDKSGTLPITGTFGIQLPAIAATTYVQSTIVTVAGIRLEDALTVTRSDQGVSAGYATASTARIFYSAIPGNGNITMSFLNMGAATGYGELCFSYTAAR